jgi:uncharacterized protein (TIGR02452 family)
MLRSGRAAFLVSSPDAPCFREDGGDLMEEPFRVSVVAAVAVQASQCAGRADLESNVREVMKGSLREAVQVARQYGHRILVLGAFEGGASRNDPEMVAQIEKEILIDKGLGRFFDLVANPILDGFRGNNYEVFARVLAPYADGQ